MTDALHVVTLELKLHSEAIFTKDSASIGVPETLDAPPGATLLGAAAARLYRELGDCAFAAFQLGGLRFSDALPLVGGACALPTPLSWHKPKVDEPNGHKAVVVDLAVADRENGVQYTQQRGQRVVVGPRGERLASTVLTRSSMRTAVDEGGRAREGLLYGFAAVPAGQRYLTQVIGEDAALVEKAVTAMLAAPLRLGRSRNAEYGVVTATRAASTPWPRPGEHRRGEPLRLLCLSDLALRDPISGAPKLLPDAAALGVPTGFTLDLDRSFLRTRSYTPWNGHRRRPDLTRDVIVAGSVLVFNTAGALSPDEAARLLAGVGEHTGAGLGRLFSQPALLNRAQFSLGEFKAPETKDAPATPDSDLPTAPKELGELGAWLCAAALRASVDERTYAKATTTANGPDRRWSASRAQWGRVRAVAAASALQPDTEATRRALLAQLRGLVDGVSAKAWGKDADELFGKPTGNANGPRDGGTFEEWSEINKNQIDYDKLHFARAVQLLARLAARRIAQADPKETER